jgi:hypothetical protein
MGRTSLGRTAAPAGGDPSTNLIPRLSVVARSNGSVAWAYSVARRHGIGAGQLYNWRKALLAAQSAAVAGRLC